MSGRTKITYRELTVDLWEGMDFTFPDEAQAEMRDVFCNDPHAEVADCICSSLEAHVAYTPDGKPIFVYGVCMYLSGGDMGVPTYNVWGFSSTVAPRWPLAMVREGRKVMRRLRREYGSLYAFCDTRYRRSIKWLDMIGLHSANSVRVLSPGATAPAVLLETD